MSWQLLFVSMTAAVFMVLMLVVLVALLSVCFAYLVNEPGGRHE
jgi:hypothetical protein